MFEVKLLGQFDVLLDGRRLLVPTRNAQSLFAYLVLNADKAYRREWLAGLLWPDSQEENARSNLRHELWRLRKAIQSGGGNHFLVDDLTIAFHPGQDFYLDVHRLVDVPPKRSSVEELTGALSVYLGELLPGFYDEWVSAERDRLVGLFEAKMARLLEILQGEERWGEVLEWGSRWITFGKWPEPAYRAIMTAYASTGDLPKAVATYERFVFGLQKDLGVEPSEQTRALYKRIKAGWKIDVNPPKTPSAKRSPHSLKRHAEPRGITLAGLRHSNLPRPLTSFIGREKEIQQVGRLVSEARLVTITGTGGVGKTRLAIEAGRVLAPKYKDGAWWVDLAPLFKTGPSKKQGLSAVGKPGAAAAQAEHEDLIGADLVVQTVAQALRVPESPGLSLLDGLVDFLQGMKLLLVIDNCEHLIEECAVLVERVLGDCPQVTILATSREALGVPGEKAWRLPSLSLPSADQAKNAANILQSEAASLFIKRMGDILPGYQPAQADLPTIAQICMRLDGIPLAIELAAARTNLLSVEEIAARLDQCFSLLTGGQRTALPRQQTLHAAIEWSYDLLSQPEKLLFRRLSVFAGSFTLEAAESICSGEGINRNEVLNLIGQLASKSLLNVEFAPSYADLPTRYRFLDTICGFGRLNLDKAEETSLMLARHAEYYLSLVDAVEPELLLQDQSRWFKLLQSENDNLRAVIEWSAESDQPERGLRLVGNLLWFWFSYGSTREGRDLALKVLKAPSAARYKYARARALNTAGFLLYLLGDTAMARQLLEEACQIQKTLEDKTSLAWSLQFLGLVLAYDKQYDLADKTFQEGLALSKNLGGVHANTFLHFLGDIYMQKGDRSRAKQIYEESVGVLRAIGSKSFLAYPLRRLGYLALAENDIPGAWKYFQESLSINNEIGDKRAVSACLTSLACLLIEIGRPAAAARLYGTVESRLETLSVNLLYMDRLELMHIRSSLLKALDETTFTAEFTRGWEMTEEQAIKLAFSFVNG